MPDQLEDDELCAICWDAPVVDRARCAECLAWFRRNGYDRPTPRQDPTLSVDEAARATGLLGARATVQWLMVPEASDVPLTLEEILHRPEWHQRAACRGQALSRS